MAVEPGGETRAEAAVTVWDRLRQAVDPTSYRPRLREGLVWRRLTTAHGQEYVTIHNPSAATYLRLSPDEFYLFEQMDGTRSVQELVVDYLMKYRTFALHRIAELVGELRDNHFLTDPAFFTWGELRRRLRTSRLGSFADAVVKAFFGREFPIHGIDGALGRAYRGGVWLLFTRPAQIVLALIALLGLPLLFLQLIARQLSFSLSASLGQDLALSYGSFVIVAVAHELSHAFTVKSYGRTVPNAGFMIFYGIPGLYVDTQDMWLEERRARVAVSWAGPYSGLVLSGLTGFALALVPDGPWVHLLWGFGAVALIYNVVQLMPLIQLDGYYILMDWLEMPQLRRNALAFVRHDLWFKLRHRRGFNREERIYAVYGLLAAAYTVYIIFLGVSFWWTRTSDAITGALSVPNVGSLLGLALVLVLVVPFVIGLIRRALDSLRTLALASRRMGGLARERLRRERIQLLENVPVLATLGHEEIVRLAGRFRPAHYPDGAPVVRQGERGDRFYIIERGQAEVLVESGGESRQVAVLGPGDYFGEQALLYDKPRTATVRAIGELHLLALTTANFRAFLARYVVGDATLRLRLDEREAIRQFPLLESLSPREKDLLLLRLGNERYSPDQTVVRQGEPGETLYLIRGGRVEVAYQDERGGELVITELGAGDFFGEIALLFGMDRIATVRALEETQLWTLARRDFWELACRYFSLEGVLEATARERLADTRGRALAARLAQWTEATRQEQAARLEEVGRR